MLKTTRLSEKLALRAFRASNNEVVGKSGNRVDEKIVDLSTYKIEKSRKLMRIPNIGAIRKPNFLNPNAKKAFNHLWLTFIKAPILQYFDSESHIRIKTDAPSYIIDGVLNQLNLNSNAPPNKSDFGQWHPVAYVMP